MGKNSGGVGRGVPDGNCQGHDEVVVGAGVVGVGGSGAEAEEFVFEGFALGKMLGPRRISCSRRRTRFTPPRSATSPIFKPMMPAPRFYSSQPKPST